MDLISLQLLYAVIALQIIVSEILVCNKDESKVSLKQSKTLTSFKNFKGSKGL